LFLGFLDNTKKQGRHAALAFETENSVNR